jgi:hypothetical protein
LKTGPSKSESRSPDRVSDDCGERDHFTVVEGDYSAWGFEYGDIVDALYIMHIRGEDCEW